MERARLDATGLGIGTVANATLSIQGTSTLPTTPLFNVASSTTASFFRITSAGDVGIGTTSPSAKLAITAGTPSNAFTISNSSDSPKFNVTSSGLVLITDNYAAFTSQSSLLQVMSGSQNTLVAAFNGRAAFGNTTDRGAVVNIVNGTTARQGLIVEGASGQSASFMQVRTSGASAGDLFTIESTGNAGIGTSTPIGKFDVWNANNTTSFNVINANGSPNTGVALFQRINNLTAGNIASSTLALVKIKEGGGVPFFVTNNNETSPYFIINNSGNVGIATSTPGYALTLGQSATTSGGISFGGDTNLYRSSAGILALNSSGTNNGAGLTLANNAVIGSGNSQLALVGYNGDDAGSIYIRKGGTNQNGFYSFGGSNLTDGHTFYTGGTPSSSQTLRFAINDSRAYETHGRLCGSRSGISYPSVRRQQYRYAVLPRTRCGKPRMFFFQCKFIRRARTFF